MPFHWKLQCYNRPQQNWAESEVGFLKPNESIRPDVTEETAINLLKTLYGLRVTSGGRPVRQLPSYDDRNFHFHVDILEADEPPNPHLRGSFWPHGYILKIMNSLDSYVPGLLESVVDALQHVHSSGAVSVPQPILTKEGQKVTRQAIDENAKGKLNAIFLVTFLPGTTLYHVPYTEDVLFQCGDLLARLTDALETFRNETLEHRRSLWSLFSVPRLRDFLFALDDDGRRRLAVSVIEEFTNDVLPAVKEFPSRLIHGDVSEHNLIVREKGPDVFEPYAVIDFMDCQRGPLLFEVAVFLVYSMLECRTMDPLQAAGVALAGFLSRRGLESNQFQLLKVCVAARLTQSLVMGAYSYKMDPSNTYVLSTSKNGWTLLERFWATPTQDLYRKWRSTIGRLLTGRKQITTS